MKHLVAVFILISICSAIAITFAIVFIAFGGVALYDNNHEAFQYALSPAQAPGIIKTSESILWIPTNLMIATNLLWFGLGLLCMRQMRLIARSARCPTNPAPK